MSGQQKIVFEKFHGAGNDFIFIASDYLSNQTNIIQLKEFVKNICHRSKHIGADGVVFTNVTGKEPSLEIKILIVNSDGSIPETCGNALRCLGLKLLLDQHWSGLGRVPVSRFIPSWLLSQNDLINEEKFILNNEIFAFLLAAKQNNIKYQTEVEVAMGLEQIVKETTLNINPFINFAKATPFINPVFVQLANPHWVFYSEIFGHFTKKDFIEFGEYAQNSLRNFVSDYSVPKANIGMIWQSDSNQHFHLVVYERGAGLTECCGSGGVAARVALEFYGKVETTVHNVHFIMPGGDIYITEPLLLENANKQRILIGPATFICAGQFIS